MSLVGSEPSKYIGCYATREEAIAECDRLCEINGIVIKTKPPDDIGICYASKRNKKRPYQLKIRQKLIGRFATVEEARVERDRILNEGV
jgi:hypothetical protein